MKLFVTCYLLAESLAAPNVGLHADLKNTSRHAQTESINTTEMNATVSAPHHARLDVGFASFEKDMLALVSESFMNATSTMHWTDSMRSACKENVSNMLSDGLKTQLKPIKTLIGKTWMALPQDDERDAYVAQLKASYASEFKDCLQTVQTHLQRSFRYLGLRAQSGRWMSLPEKLLLQCEASITGNLMSERCYDKSGEQSLKAAHTFLQTKAEAQNKFCMPSVFEALAHRLHDSQGLIGMTMQFESKSMALATSPSVVNDIVQQAGTLGQKD